MRYCIIVLTFIFSFYIIENIRSHNKTYGEETNIEKPKNEELKVGESKADEPVPVETPSVLKSPKKAFALINQNNEPVVLDSLIGKPLVMSFIFTRCPLPEMCPLIMQKVVKVQEGLNKEYKDKVFFAVMTFDPEYDTPEVLKKYGEYYGVNYDNFIYLTGKTEDVETALNHFRVYFKKEADGQIAHTLETMVMDEKGKIIRVFPTTIWNPKSVIKEVEKVIKNWESPDKAEVETDTKIE